jgi:hypothetical protein
MHKLLLLEPYRSALMVEALDEGLAMAPRGLDLAASPSVQIGRSPDLQRRVRMLALLFDEVSIVHHEKPGDAAQMEQRVYPQASLLPLRDEGIVSFSAPSSDAERVQRLQNVRTFEDWWGVEQALLDAYEPVIASQLMARGKLPHPALLSVLRAHRLGLDVGGAMSAVPQEFRDFARVFAELDPPYDNLVISTLNELLAAEAVDHPGMHVAMAEPELVWPIEGSNAAVEAVFRIVLEELLAVGMVFPVPENLRDIRQLRSDPALVDFRVRFRPWLGALRSPNAELEATLRQEIRNTVGRFKFATTLDGLADLCALVALPLGLVDPAPKTVIAGLSAARLGLPKLAKYWRAKTKWLGLCRAKGTV